VESDTLMPTAKSYVRNFPQAVGHVFLRPYPFERKSFLFQGSAMETYFCLIFFFLAFFFFQRGAWGHLRNPFVLACLFFSLSNYILIGYTVPFIGAIVRYKSIYEALLLTVAIIITDWHRVIRVLGLKIKSV
jgi:hypothetical protein